MVLKLYGIAQATYTQRVLVVLKEKKVPYELITVNFLNGEHKSAAYLEKHPFGQIPYIDDDGFILFESSAIAKYISNKYRSSGTPLLPEENDVKAIALFEQACSVEENNFSPAATGIVVETFGKPLRGLETDQKVVDEMVAKLDAKLDGYEAMLKKHKYLAGDKITVADLVHLPAAQIMQNAGIKLLEDTEKRPNVARWWKDVSSRPTWQAVLEAAKA